jgi:hypothetical protein
LAALPRTKKRKASPAGFEPAQAIEQRTRATLSAGDTARARAMCTADLYFGDVEVRDMHSGLAVTERLSRRLDG